MNKERADRIVDSAFAAHGLNPRDRADRDGCDIVDVFKVRAVCLKVVELAEIECLYTAPAKRGAKPLARLRRIRHRPPKGNAKGGKRKDIGFYVRSAMEANVCRWLKWRRDRWHDTVTAFEYEPQRFEFPIQRGTTAYLPDFRVWEGEKSYYIEVKGWMDPKSKTALKRMKKYYPDIKIDVIDGKRYSNLSRKLGPLIPNWE